MKISMDPCDFRSFVVAMWDQVSSAITEENVFEYLHNLTDEELYDACTDFPELRPYLVDLITNAYQLVALLRWWHECPFECYIPKREEIDPLIERIVMGGAARDLLQFWKEINEKTPNRTPVYLALQDHITDLMDRVVVCSAVFRKPKPSSTSKKRSRSYSWEYKENISSSTGLFRFIFLYFIKDAEILVPRIQELDGYWFPRICDPDYVIKYEIPPHVISLCCDYFQQFDLNAREITLLSKIPEVRNDLLSRIHTAREVITFLLEFSFNEAQQYLSKFVDVVFTDSDYDAIGDLLWSRNWPNPELLIDSIIHPRCVAKWYDIFPSDKSIMSLRLQYAGGGSRK